MADGLQPAPAVRGFADEAHRLLHHATAATLCPVLGLGGEQRKLPGGRAGNFELWRIHEIQRLALCRNEANARHRAEPIDRTARSVPRPRRHAEALTFRPFAAPASETS